MKKISLLLMIIVCSLLYLQAQELQTQEETAKFSGNTYESLAGTGKSLYLYNVGTEKFLCPGKSWGTEAALIYDDFGMAMTLTETDNGNYALNSTFSGTGMGTTIGIDENNGTEKGRIYVDRNNGKQYTFEPVTTTNGTTVYQVKLHIENNNVYLYAGSSDADSEAKDEILFTNDREATINAGTNEKYFQWMLISKDDLIKTLEEKAADGTSDVVPDATFYITNQGFARGNNATWSTDDGVTYVKKDGTDSFLNHLDNGNYGQYFFTHIDGTGYMYQEITLSVPGIYRFRCNGFTSNSSVRMYAWVDKDGDTEKDDDEIIYKAFTEADRPYDTNVGNDENKTAVQNIGIELYDDGNYGNFVNELFFYVSPEDLKNGHTVQIGFNKTGNDGATPNTIDNVRLHYLGENPLILDDTATDGAYLTNEAEYPHKNVQVFLKRNFRVGTWNTLVLPVDVTKSQLDNVFNNGYIVAEAATSGLAEDNYMAIWFKTKTMPAAQNAIALEKGKFYLIYPKGESYKTVEEVNLLRTQEEDGNAIGTVKETVTFVDNTVNVGLIDLGAHSTEGILTPQEGGIDVQSAALSSTSDHNAIQYNGTFTKHATANSPVGGENGPAYVFVQKKANQEQSTSAESKCEMRYIKNQTEIRGFRWWITDVEQNDQSGAKPVFITIDGILDNFETTSIASALATENNAPNGIYSASGILVSKGTSLDGLQSGLYIVNGRKVLVK